jgi:Protein of unknown function (DUF2442)
VGEDAPVSKPGKVVATDTEIDSAIKKGRDYDKRATKIVRAQYDRKRDQIVVDLSTGATLTVPRRNLPRLDTYQPDDLGAVEIEPPGYSLWFDKPDVGIRIEGLLRAAGGEGLVRSIAAQALGSVKSVKKSEAARKNGAAGGRPPAQFPTAQARTRLQPGLDGRSRDTDGEIRRKKGDTLVGTLRQRYGDNFARGFRGDMKLDTLLDRTGAKSLDDYLKRNK